METNDMNFVSVDKPNKASEVLNLNKSFKFYFKIWSNEHIRNTKKGIPPIHNDHCFLDFCDYFDNPIDDYYT